MNKRKPRGLIDPRVYECASFFVLDENDRDELAVRIQAAIEDWFYDRERAGNLSPTSSSPPSDDDD